MNLSELKSCPFCGGEAEMDSQRAFRALGSGNIGSAVAIYCLQCSADMTLCHADHPGVEIDALCAELREQWNRRALARVSSAGEKPDADAMREVLVGSYKGLLVLRTMLKRANLTTGMEVTDQWLRDMEKVMPELPGLSALR